MNQTKHKNTLHEYLSTFTKKEENIKMIKPMIKHFDKIGGNYSK